MFQTLTYPGRPKTEFELLILPRVPESCHGDRWQGTDVSAPSQGCPIQIRTGSTAAEFTHYVSSPTTCWAQKRWLNSEQLICEQGQADSHLA